MAILHEKLKEYVGIPSVIPIITHYDFVSPDPDMIHPQLSKMVDKDKLPNFFALNAFELSENEGTEIPW